MGWVSIFILCAISHGLSGFSREKADGYIEKNMETLLQKLIPQMPPCIVLVYTSLQPFLQLPDEIQAIRVMVNSDGLRPALLASFNMKCYGYITESDAAEDFLTALGEVRHQSLARHSPRILILPSSRDATNTSCQIFKHPEVTYIPDLLVVSLLDNPGEPFVLVLLTNSFLSETEGTCFILGYWPSEIVDFFPEKLNDLKGKVIRLATLEYPPYTLLNPSFEGMEARLLKEFCRKLNCTLSLITDDDLWGEIYENGTGIGLIGNVYMDKADIGAGAYGAWEEEFKYVEYSFPYLITSVHCLVPKPKQLPEWMIPLLPFSSVLWAIQIFSVLVAAAVMYAVNRAALILTQGLSESMLRGEFASFGGTVLRAMGMAALQPPPDRLPISSPLRKFFTIFEVLFLFFTTIYSGALSSVLTVPLYYPPIDSAMELYESGIPWAADHEAWIYSLKGATEPHIQGLVSKFEVHDSETLIELAKKGGYGFSIEVMAGGHVPQTKHLSGEMILGLHVMKNKIYSTSLVFLLRKGSPYTEKFNRLLGRCLDTGMLLLWETNVTLTHLSSRLQTAVKISEGSRVEVHEPTQLKIIHIQGAFIMLALGLMISFFVFLFELFKMSKNDKQQIFMSE